MMLLQEGSNAIYSIDPSHKKYPQNYREKSKSFSCTIFAQYDMEDWNHLMERAHKDVMAAVKVWSVVLEEAFGPRLDYAYAKGSALKKWDSFIDYVPVLSDVDIHLMTTDDDQLFSSDRKGFLKSIEVSRNYEEQFLNERPDHLHIPRSQVIQLNHIIRNLPDFVQPRVADVHVMIGAPLEHDIPTKESIRTADYNQLEELEPILDDLPRQSFDRVSLDFWALLRRLCWRVSPTPLRLLTQTASDPRDVWRWNRTRIIHELEKQSYGEIANSYRRFYELGWDLFLSEFKGLQEFREIIVHAHDVLRGCLDHARKIRCNSDS